MKENNCISACVWKFCPRLSYIFRARFLYDCFCK